MSPLRVVDALVANGAIHMLTRLHLPLDLWPKNNRRHVILERIQAKLTGWLEYLELKLRGNRTKDLFLIRPYPTKWQP